MKNTSIIRRACLWLFVTGVAVGTSVLLTSSSEAQGFDHLKCRGVDLDNKNVSKIPDVRLFTDFASENCKVLDKGAQLCVPATKDGQDDFRGPELESAFLCYKIQCDTSPNVGLIVNDQFGEHRITLGEAREVCAPACAFGDGFEICPEA